MKPFLLAIVLIVGVRLSAQTVDAGRDTSICAGQSITLHATVSDANAMFSWEPAEFFDDPTGATPVCAPTESRTYTLTASWANGKVAADTIRITVLPKPEPMHTVEDIICYDSPGAITLSLDGAQAPFMLTVNDAPYGESSTPNIGIIAYTPVPYAVVTQNAFGCRDTLNVIVGGPLFPLQFRALSIRAFTEPGSIRAVAFGGAGGWRFSLNDVTYQSSGRFDGLAPGVYTIYLRDNNDCLVTARAEVR